MSDKMTIVDKKGRVRYIIEEDEVIDILNCPHSYEEEGPCIYCNLYPDEVANKEV